MLFNLLKFQIFIIFPLIIIVALFYSRKNYISNKMSMLDTILGKLKQCAALNTITVNFFIKYMLIITCSLLLSFIIFVTTNIINIYCGTFALISLEILSTSFYLFISIDGTQLKIKMSQTYYIVSYIIFENLRFIFKIFMLNLKLSFHLIIQILWFILNFISIILNINFKYSYKDLPLLKEQIYVDITCILSNSHITIIIMIYLSLYKHFEHYVFMNDPNTPNPNDFITNKDGSSNPNPGNNNNNPNTNNSPIYHSDDSDKDYYLNPELIPLDLSEFDFSSEKEKSTEKSTETSTSQKGKEPSRLQSPELSTAQSPESSTSQRNPVGDSVVEDSSIFGDANNSNQASTSSTTKAKNPVKVRRSVENGWEYVTYGQSDIKRRINKWPTYNEEEKRQIMNKLYALAGKTRTKNVEIPEGYLSQREHNVFCSEVDKYCDRKFGYRRIFTNIIYRADSNGHSNGIYQGTVNTRILNNINSP